MITMLNTDNKFKPFSKQKKTSATITLSKTTSKTQITLPSTEFIHHSSQKETNKLSKNSSIRNLKLATSVST
jgi:hypothetical protein